MLPPVLQTVRVALTLTQLCSLWCSRHLHFSRFRQASSRRSAAQPRAHSYTPDSPSLMSPLLRPAATDATAGPQLAPSDFFRWGLDGVAAHRCRYVFTNGDFASWVSAMTQTPAPAQQTPGV